MRITVRRTADYSWLGLFASTTIAMLVVDIAAGLPIIQTVGWTVTIAVGCCCIRLAERWARGERRRRE